jgi:hypothetical protein
MVSPVINVLVKSDRIHRKVPQTGQTVRVEGRKGLFLVVRSDQVARVADVMDRTGPHHVQENVPFALLRSVSSNVSEALHQFLESAKIIPAYESEG